MPQDAALKAMEGRPRPLQAALTACRTHFASAAVFSALLNLLYLAPTLFMLQIYSRVIPTRGATTLLFLTLIFALATATLSALDFVRSRLLVRASLRLDRLVSPQIIGALLAGRDGPRSSDALRKFDQLRGTLTGPGVLALFDAPWTPIYVVFCFVIHPLVGLLALAGAAILLVLAALNEQATRGPVQRATDASGRAYASLDHSAAVGGAVQALGMGPALVNKHLAERRLSSTLVAKASFSGSAYLTLTKFVRMLLQSLALALGAYLAINQMISAGAIFAASLLVTRALAPIEQVVGAWRSIVQSRAAWTSVRDLLAVNPADAVKTLLPSPGGQLSVDHVTVLSPGRDRILVNNVSLRIAPGERIGVVGASGAGKSTLVRAIAGAVPLAKGAVRFDGVDAKDWDAQQLARSVGYAPQEPTLLEGTVKDNIARFDTYRDTPPGELDAAVVRAAKLVGAHDLIVQLPQAYDTPLGFGGQGLSAGQAQRIALARAFFGQPKVVILDEPNAHLDDQGEAALLEAITDIATTGASVIVVAHRTGVLAAVDTLIVVRDGAVEMMGPRDRVLQQLNAARAVVTPMRAASGTDR